MAGAFNIATGALQVLDKSTSSIARNIASEKVVAGRQEEIFFSTMVTGGGVGGAPAAGGVRGSAFTLISQTGDLSASACNTHMAIDGKGLFPVATSITGTAASNYAFTRDGTFSIDSSGKLVNLNGAYLLGWPTDVNGIPKVGDTSSLSQLQPINLSNVNQVATATTQINLGQKLPANPAVGSKITTSIGVYNSLGLQSTTSLEWTYTGPKTWKVAITNNEGGAASTVTRDGVLPAKNFLDNTGSGGTDDRLTVVFDNNGLPATFDGAATPPSLAIAWPSGAAASTIALNLGTVGKADGFIMSGNSTNSIPTVQNQDGKASGTPVGVSIGEDGTVSFNYDNGQTLKGFKIPLVNFSNVDGLQAVSGNMYVPSAQSGSPLLYTAGTGGVGKVASSQLEGSTINIAENFTNLIRTSQGYSACVNVISSAKEQKDLLNSLMR